MSIEKLKQELDLEKNKFNTAKHKIEELRLKIALATCPIKIGEKVKYKKGGKDYEGIVEYINYATDLMDNLDPQPGARTGWSAGGHRVNKSSGTVGEVSFAIVSFEASLNNGVWEINQRTLDQLFGTNTSA